MGILAAVAATEERYLERQGERRANLERIEAGEGVAVGCSTPFGVGFLERGLRAAHAVALVRLQGEEGENVACGTGFLVSPRLLLTNHHLLGSPEQAGHALVEFNDQEEVGDAPPAGEVRGLAPETLFLSDADLDYTLVALSGDAVPATRGWLPLVSAPAPPLVGQHLNIIHCPNGGAKRLCLRHTRVVDSLERFLHYQTDSDAVTSGAAVFNDGWELVALHHGGVPKRDDHGQVLSVDGQPWQEWMGEQRIAWLAQEGVRANRLLEHLLAQSWPAEAEELRQELLDAGVPVAPAAPAAVPPDPSRPVAGEVWLDEVEQDGSEAIDLALPSDGPPRPNPTEAGGSTWTIPLTLSVSLNVGAPTRLEQDGGIRQRWALFGGRPAQPPPPPPPPPVTAADFRLESLALTSFDWPAALSLCLASELAYSPPARVRAQAQAWGFRDSAFVERAAAQGFLAWTDELVMVTFRGTESTADWLSNLNVSTRVIPGVGAVHAGFLGQFEALRPELERLLRGRANLPLLVTGHSLGGAIAVLAATSWANSRPVRALYTYGQPAVAKDTSGARAIGTLLAGRYHRLVNNADVVPRVPPTYRHGGHLLHFDGQGRVTSQETTPVGGPSAGARGGDIADAMLSPADFQALQQQLRTTAGTRDPNAASRGLISDHMLPGYLRKTRQQFRP